MVNLINTTKYIICLLFTESNTAEYSGTDHLRPLPLESEADIFFTYKIGNLLNSLSKYLDENRSQFFFHHTSQLT